MLAPGGRVYTVTDSEEIKSSSGGYRRSSTSMLSRKYRAMGTRVRMNELMLHSGFDKPNTVSVEYIYRLEDIGSYRDKIYSSLHLIPVEAFQRGLARLEQTSDGSQSPACLGTSCCGGERGPIDRREDGPCRC